MKPLNKIALVLLTLSLVGCSWGSNPVSKIEPLNNSGKSVELIALEKAGVVTNSNTQVYTAEVSKNAGASIYFNLVQPKEGFSVKANQDGVPAKKLSDIDHFLIYLVKNSNTTAYPLNGDPLGTSDLVSGPFTVSYTGSGNKLVKFTGIPDSAGKAYYVAVRAQDASNNDLIQDNNGSATAWTGTTASTPKLAVSTGNGITVNSSLQVSDTTALSLAPNLLNGTGARIDANIAPNPGTIAGSIAGAGITYSYVLTTLVSGLSFPNDVKLDGSGNIYIADTANNIIKKFDGTTTTTLVSGLNSVKGLVLDGSGNIYIADTGNNEIKKFDGSTTTTLVSGLSNPSRIAVDSSGNVYFSDSSNNAIKKFDGSTTTTLVSSGISFPEGVAVDSSGNIYIADSGNNAIKKFDGTTTTTLVSGLSSPNGIALDSSGNIYIADSGNNAIKKFDGTTTTTLISGLSFPTGVAIDSNGNIYIADRNNNAIKKATKTEI